MNVQSEQQASYAFFTKLVKLTIGGAVVFWAITVVTSLLPIAADYRAAYSNWSAQSVWIGSLFVGIIIGCGISYILVRFFNKLPTKNSIVKSGILGFIALVVVTLLIDVPRGFFGPSDIPRATYWFLIGLAFNAVRFLALGLIIGFLYKKMHTH